MLKWGKDYMKTGDKNKLFFLVKILFAITLTVFIYFFIKQDFKVEDKWVSITEIRQGTKFEHIDGQYIYCNSYNNINIEKLKFIIIVLALSCLVIALSIELIFLLKKLNNRQTSNNKLLSSKQGEINEIISKYSNDEQELKVQNILNDDFKKNVYNMFCNLQFACMNSDYKTLQNLLTKELYNKYCTGLATLKLKSRKNIVDDFEYVSVKFIDIYEDDYECIISVHIKVKFYGYIIDTQTNEIMRGTKEEKMISTYMLSLVKYKNKSNDWLIAEKVNISKNNE